MARDTGTENPNAFDQEGIKIFSTYGQNIEDVDLSREMEVFAAKVQEFVRAHQNTRVTWCQSSPRFGFYMTAVVEFTEGGDEPSD